MVVVPMSSICHACFHHTLFSSPSLPKDQPPHPAYIMSTFHPFQRLPTELRQRIWELSMAPRKLVIRARRRYRSPVAPTLLHTCMEARSYLRKYYTKSFRPVFCPDQYTWVNFDLDVIQMDQNDTERFPTEQRLVQQIVVEGDHPETFYFYTIGNLRHMVSLRTVTVLDMAPHDTADRWWQNWDSIMEMMYFTDDPVPFYTKIIGYGGAKIPEINPTNYLKVERDDRRARVAANPEDFDPGYEVSESDDDVDAPHRFRTGWQHVEGCNCPSRQPS
ncbi:hypothetical protein BX600DRAFT_451843 [Xylariales sp. PMI_506]|nr:hypothetical protein BX600DRAFT_451843 [Xylariales sp. PMI_506]